MLLYNQREVASSSLKTDLVRLEIRSLKWKWKENETGLWSLLTRAMVSRNSLSIGFSDCGEKVRWALSYFNLGNKLSHISRCCWHMVVEPLTMVAHSLWWEQAASLFFREHHNLGLSLKLEVDASIIYLTLWKNIWEKPMRTDTGHCRNIAPFFRVKEL